MAHILHGVHAGDKYSGGHKQAEEQAQRIHLKGDADGVAAGRRSAAQPIGNNLAVHHDGLDERDQQGQRGGDRQKRDGISEGLVSPQHNNQEGTEEKNHDGVYGEVLIT